MIDEKKIEEAAQGAADLYEQDLPIMSYNEDTEVDGQHHFCQEFGAELFKDGVKWAINEFLKDLWHPANEEPERNKKLLGYDIDGYSIYRWIDQESEWKDFVYNTVLQKWLYIDDLLTNEGGEK